MRATLAVVPRLVARLIHAFPELGADRAEGALMDAAADWFAKGGTNAAPPLTGRLYTAAWCRARDILVSERARQVRESRWAAEGGFGSAVPTPDQEADGAAVENVCEAIIERLPDAQLKITFQLWMSGARDSEVYSRALGIDAAPREQMRRQVKRQKDRLMKRLRVDASIRRLASLLRLAEGGRTEDHPAGRTPADDSDDYLTGEGDCLSDVFNTQETR